MEAKYKKDAYPAKVLYLFWSWKETKSLIKCLFDVDYEESDRENAKRYTQFDKLLIVKMRLSGFNTNDIRTLVAPNVALSTIKTWVRNCAPLWEIAGLHLSNLVIDADYLNYEKPTAYDDYPALANVACLVDGKDMVSDTIRANSHASRHQWSSKMNSSSFRVITWSTPTGLAFEYTDVYFARVGESRLVEHHGRIRGRSIPVRNDDRGREGEHEELHGLGAYQENNRTQPVHDGERDNDEELERIVVERLEEFQDDDSNDEHDHDCLQDREDFEGMGGEYLEREGHDKILEWMQESSRMTRELHQRKGNKAISMNRKQKNIQKHEVKAFIRHENRYRAPFANNDQFLDQLLVHRNLDEAFHVTKDLSPCSLSYYIAFYRDRRESIIEWLKGDRHGDPPIVYPLFLEKIPAGWTVLADRGFARDAIYYPNINGHLTPHFLSGRTGFTADEISADYEVCKLRYTCEVVFSRVQESEIVKDKIKKTDFGILQSAVTWGHAHNNLHAPIKQPRHWKTYIEENGLIERCSSK